MATGTHVLIVGGVSVNDPKHDGNPYNFINPGARRAITLRGQAKAVVVLVFAPPYRVRVLKQKKEHPTVTYTAGELKDPTKRNQERFLDVLKGTGGSKGFPVVELSTAAALTDELLKRPVIAAVEYFGHSDPARMFLQYNTTGATVGAGEVLWGEAQARAVPPGRFAPGAYFWSFGCYQGNPGGLAELLRPVWNISCIGSSGDTSYVRTGQGNTFPASAQGWVKYPAPVPDPRTGVLTYPPKVPVADPG